MTFFVIFLAACSREILFAFSTCKVSGTECSTTCDRGTATFFFTKVFKKRSRHFGHPVSNGSAKLCWSPSSHAGEYMPKCTGAVYRLSLRCWGNSI